MTGLRNILLVSSIFFTATLYLVATTAISTKSAATTAPAQHKHKKHTKVVDGNITEIEDEGWEYENQTFVDTRRILYGRKVAIGKRPYMVYLHLTKESAKIHKYRGWLCGGVIVHAYYVLTSAACVEDADHFYVVSGTNKYVDSFDYKKDECVCKHRRRVVWKCVPKNYKFDFQDSIKWSSNDIAIVKVDKCFKFGQIEKGCQFPTQPIPYNNISRELERPNTKGWIAGWGSMGNFREGVYRRDDGYNTVNAKCLQEAKVCLMDNEACAKKWAQRFRPIIQQFMICTRDVMRRLSEICDKKYANCTEIESNRRALEDSTDVEKETSLDLGRHLRDPDNYVSRRASMQGGFCENDHGGPLIVKYQNKDRAIGVISACKIDPRTHTCHGPFLYTSIFKNRQFISCSIYKDVEESCRRVFRTGVTHEEYTVDWSGVEEDHDFDNDKAEREGDDEKKTKAKPDSDDDDDDDDSSDNKDDNDDKDDKDDDDDDETTEKKEALREAKPEKKEKKPKKEKKEAEKKEESASEETTKKDKSKKKEEKKEEKKQEEKDDKKTTKKKSKKSKSKSKKAKASLRSEKKLQSYESSKDDKVNEPDE